jgi:hypothetical protein
MVAAFETSFTHIITGRGLRKEMPVIDADF